VLVSGSFLQRTHYWLQVCAGKCITSYKLGVCARIVMVWCVFSHPSPVTSDSERVKDLDLDTRGRSKPQEQD